MSVPSYPEDKNGKKLIWRMDHEAEAYRGNMERGQYVCFILS
jgi:hypothetical protein